MTEEQIEISRRKQEANDKQDKAYYDKKAKKAEIKRIQKLCRKTSPRGHVYEWYPNTSLSGGCYACVGCGRRRDGMIRLDKDGVKIF